MKAASKPVVTLRLSNSSEEKVIEKSQPNSTANPQFLEIISFDKVKLTQDPIYWPMLQIHIKDKALFGGCEECFSISPLVNYANWLTDAEK